MNSFVIAVGSYVKPLTDTAIEIRAKDGPGTADNGGTAVPGPVPAPPPPRKVQKTRAAAEGRDDERVDDQPNL